MIALRKRVHDEPLDLRDQVELRRHDRACERLRPLFVTALGQLQGAITALDALAEGLETRDGQHLMEGEAEGFADDLRSMACVMERYFLSAVECASRGGASDQAERDAGQTPDQQALQPLPALPYVATSGEDVVALGTDLAEVLRQALASRAANEGDVAVWIIHGERRSLSLVANIVTASGKPDVRFLLPDQG
jgi:hypothetical protein